MRKHKKYVELTRILELKKITNYPFNVCRWMVRQGWREDLPIPLSYLKDGITYHVCSCSIYFNVCTDEQRKEC
jgi:hypothetical protein